MTDLTSHEQTTKLLDSTIQTLNGELDSGNMDNGIGLISQWLETLRTNENTMDIADTLAQLQASIQQDSIDSNRIVQLLASLADQTRMLSTQVGPEGEIANQLEVLSQALQAAAGQIT